MIPHAFISNQRLLLFLAILSGLETHSLSAQRGEGAGKPPAFPTVRRRWRRKPLKRLKMQSVRQEETRIMIPWKPSKEKSATI